MGGRAVQLCGQLVGYCLHLPVLAAAVARRPVELAKAVEDCAPNPVLCVSREGDFFIVLKLARSIEQTHGARMNQIVQFHVYAESLLDMARNGLYELHMLQDQFVSSRVVRLNLLVDAGGFGDGVHLSFSPAMEKAPAPPAAERTKASNDFQITLIEIMT